MKNLSIILTAVAVTILSGCGKDKENQAALAQKLNGKIAGQAWTHTFGAVRQKVATGSYAISLHNVPDGGDPCTATYVVGQPLLMVSFSLASLGTGAYDVSPGSGSSIYLTRAVDSGSGFSSTSTGAFGEVRLTKVDSTTVEGELDVKANDSNFVKGTFTAKICK